MSSFSSLTSIASLSSSIGYSDTTGSVTRGHLANPRGRGSGSPQPLAPFPVESKLPSLVRPTKDPAVWSIGSPYPDTGLSRPAMNPSHKADAPVRSQRRAGVSRHTSSTDCPVGRFFRAVDADEQVSQRVDQRRTLHRQLPLVPRQAQLAQGADLCIGDEAGTKVRLRVRFRRCHPSDGHVDDLVPEGTERAAVGLREQYPGETLVVDQRADERLEPGLGWPARPRRSERIDTLRHHRDGMVDDGAPQLGERREALVEIALGEPGGWQTRPTPSSPAPSVPTIVNAASTSRFRRSLRRSAALIPLKGIVTW